MNLRELTAAAGIERVVWVDDLFDPPGTIDAASEIRELVARAKNREIAVSLAGRTLVGDFSVDEMVAEISELVDEAAVSQADVVTQLRAQLGEADSIPDYSGSAIHRIIESFGEAIVTCGAAGWPEVRATLDDEKRTLVVVDREFTVSGVSVPLGDDILLDLVKAQAPTIHVVMLTRSVESDPEQLRAQLANALGIPLQDFVVMAKTVSDDDAEAEARLCSCFQSVFTHQACILLTRKIQEVAKRNLETAVEILAAESVYDLDRVVFQNSLVEGASELDVLTRMLLLRQRVAVDSELASSQEYFQLLSRLRDLRGLAGPLVAAEQEASGMLEQWRRDEVCDPGERINSSHSPLSCGDVFQRSDSNDVYYVLLGQPCDMAVRSSDGFRKAHEAIFVQAGKCVPDVDGDRERESQGPPHHFFPMPALPVDGRDQWRLDFRNWASVNLRLLDFAVFSGNGAVRFSLTAEAPVFLLPGWKQLLLRAKRRIAAQDKLPAEYALLSLSEKLKGTAASKSEDVVALSYARIGRLRNPWAVTAYATFASYQARAAFDHDFARSPAGDV